MPKQNKTIALSTLLLGVALAACLVSHVVTSMRLNELKMQMGAHTNPHTWQDYSQDAQTILLAINEEQLASNSRHVKVNDVVRRVLAGQRWWRAPNRTGDGLSDAATEALQHEAQTTSPDVEAVYGVILGLARDTSKFQVIEGQGNLGTPTRGLPPAAPSYVKIRLTDRGKQLVNAHQEPSPKAAAPELKKSSNDQPAQYF